MNAAVNDDEDDPPFEVALRALVQRYGAFRVLLGALRQMRPQKRLMPIVLNAYLRRDIGLCPLQDLVVRADDDKGQP